LRYSTTVSTSITARPTIAAISRASRNRCRRAIAATRSRLRAISASRSALGRSTRPAAPSIQRSALTQLDLVHQRALAAAEPHPLAGLGLEPAPLTEAGLRLLQPLCEARPS